MMHNFNDEAKCIPTPTNICEPKQENLSLVLNEACCKAADALRMARVINQHMFANGDGTEGKQADPKCFRDALINHDYCLKELCKELKHIMDQLGV